MKKRIQNENKSAQKQESEHERGERANQIKNNFTKHKHTKENEKTYQVIKIAKNTSNKKVIKKTILKTVYNRLILFLGSSRNGQQFCISLQQY